MHTEQHEALAEPAVPQRNDLKEFTSYQDGDGLVICDKQNPKAWIRSDETTRRFR